ncbi:hypothetical protein RHMOL_Rhmol04G0171200 [Rhododendron molle]|uniref:Uncharacterized protein n=1 Tax=Rhododendron molle TaxID=49168 RepID=A0ACC0P3T1_RHOML|nr:hypothetical protein RHMOL_Rhmol04G0171200 [Rhododendron molle]
MSLHGPFFLLPAIWPCLVSISSHIADIAASSHVGDGGGVSRQLSRSLFPSVNHYSSQPSFDEPLLKVIESEIKCAEESNDQDEVWLERGLLGDLMMWSSIANLKENLHKITLDVHDDDGDEGIEIYNSPDQKGHLHTDR